MRIDTLTFEELLEASGRADFAGANPMGGATADGPRPIDAIMPRVERFFDDLLGTCRELPVLRIDAAGQDSPVGVAGVKADGHLALLIHGHLWHLSPGEASLAPGRDMPIEIARAFAGDPAEEFFARMQARAIDGASLRPQPAAGAAARI